MYTIKTKDKYIPLHGTSQDVSMVALNEAVLLGDVLVCSRRRKHEI